MNNDRPLRAVLMTTFCCDGTVYHKGEIYDIAKFVTMTDKPMVLITDGRKTCLVTPSTIQVLAPEPKQKPNPKKKWPRKKRVS